MSEEITIKLKREDLWKYSTFFLLAVVVIGAIFMVMNDGNSTQTVVTQQNNPLADTVEVDFKQVIAEEVPTIGSDKATVTILEFADFSCPYCAAASGANDQYVQYMQQNQPGWQAPVSSIIEQYVESGDVRIASFYSMGHSGGHAAQVAGWCLNEQSSELFWEFSKKAYANIADVEDDAKMRTLALTVKGVDSNKLDTCLNSGKFEERFAEEQSLGASLGMSGTPGFVVGRTDGSGEAVIVRGAYPFQTFQEIIESML